VGGALGTKAGVAAGLGLVAFLSLGPLGLFVTVFICATAGGVIGSGLFKWGGGKVYDESVNLGDQIYHSIDELIGAYN
jgi:uncharacterized membrane protein YdjX (TVP38/TMEM64 family)